MLDSIATVNPVQVVPGDRALGGKRTLHGAAVEEPEKSVPDVEIATPKFLHDELQTLRTALQER